MKLPTLIALFALLGSALAQVNTPAPMLANPFPTCEQFTQVLAPETCESIAGKASISLDLFLRLNPGLSGYAGCQSGNIPQGFWFCTKALPKKAHKPKPKPQPVSKGHPKPKPSSKKPHPKPPASKPTKAPEKDTGPCDFGPCWESWVKVITDEDDYILTSATNSCKVLENRPQCTDVSRKDFPLEVKQGCDSCDMLTSGCSCMLAGKYHTITVGFQDPDPQA